MAKKAQGLSINFIVIAAIAALIMVVVIAFTIGGFSSSFSKIKGTETSDLETARSDCKTACNVLTISSINDYEKSTYCNQRFTFDVNGDGEIGSESKPDFVGNIRERNIACWDKAIDVECRTSFTTATGSSTDCLSVGDSANQKKCYCISYAKNSQRKTK